MSAPDTVVGRYAALVASGAIDRDPVQEEIAARLDQVTADLLARPAPTRPSRRLGLLFGRREPPPEPVKGLYLWGEVGRGKTMLMDIFFETVPILEKRRSHFLSFMADTHGRLQRVRREIASGVLKGDDPVPPVAEEIARETRLLCFDEFSVTDIADAMILGRLFTQLFLRGVVLVATSNVEPRNLYRDGVNRGHFLPFIELLSSHVDVIRIDISTDYRLTKLAGRPVYFTPLGRQADEDMQTLWKGLTGTDRGSPVAMDVLGRSVVIPEAVAGVARASFDDLCAHALGASDYLALAAKFHTLFLKNVPPLSADVRNETKRFITLIDALYDNHNRLVISAAAEPTQLFTGTDGTEAFEFQRTASRLIEMRSTSWIEATETDKAP